MGIRIALPLALRRALLGSTLVMLMCGLAQAQEKKLNILVIMGDDIGWFNPSVYHRGIMGYRTPKTATT